MRSRVGSWLLAGAIALCAPGAGAIMLAAPFDADYTFVDLGGAPGVPALYGGLAFKAGDPDTLLIGGSANDALGGIYEIGLARDGDGHITGFSGPASLFAAAPFIDGGLAYGPSGVLFYTGYPVNTIDQLEPGSASADKSTVVTGLGVAISVGALTFVPAGFAGAGQLKVVSYDGSLWYTIELADDGAGTFDLVSASSGISLSGGLEGIAYVLAGNPGFTADSVLVAEYSAGQISTYEIDANGDPIPESGRLFVTDLSGAEGAAVDPVTGDFVFSTFGGGDRVVVVRGFTQVVPEAGRTLLVAGLLAVGARARAGRSRRRRRPSPTATVPS